MSRKKIRKHCCSISLFLCAMASAYPAVAQPTPAAPTVDARQVANEVQAFYDRTTSLQAKFLQTYYYKLYDRYERSHGVAVFKKPGRMRWDYAQPNGKIVVADGKRLMIFEPGENREPGQLLEQEINENQLPQAFSFLTGVGRIDQDFELRLLDARRFNFEQGRILELRPKKPTPTYDRIVFYVGKGATQGVVHRVLVIDAAGNRNRFDFEDIRFNPSVPEQTFRLRVPPRTRHVRP